MVVAQIGLTEGLLVGVASVVGGVATQMIASRQARRTNRDTLLETRDATLWERMEKDNERLRQTVEKQELHIDRLERALVNAGIPIPD